MNAKALSATAWDGMKYATRRAMVSISVGIIAFSAIVFLMAVGPDAERRFAPVVTDVALVERLYSAADQTLQFRLEVTRHRGDVCDFERQDWYRLYDDDRAAEHAAYFLVSTEAIPGASLPAGRVRGRLLKVWVKDAPQIFAWLTYRCAFEPWTTRVPIGPFAVVTPGGN